MLNTLLLAATAVTFSPPVNVLDGGRKHKAHGDHFYSIPAAGGRTVIGRVMLGTVEGLAVSNDGGSSWRHERLDPPLLPWGVMLPYNSSCIRDLGDLAKDPGPTAPIRKTFVSNHTNIWCVSDEGVVTAERRPANVSFRGMPAALIELNIAEVGYADMGGGRVVITPYVRFSDIAQDDEPLSAYKCCLNWTCPCPQHGNLDVCPCPPRVPLPCTPGAFGPGVPSSSTDRMGLCFNATTLSFLSTDGGYTFHYQSVVASQYEYPEGEEGPNENALTLLPDGTLLSVMRFDGGDGKPHMRHRMYLMATSADQGRTWASKRMPYSGSLLHPNAMVGSARPHVLTLDDGTVLLLGIRPLFGLWVNRDWAKRDGAPRKPEGWVLHNLAQAHNDGLAAHDALRFCPEFANTSRRVDPDTWNQEGYPSLVKVAAQEAMVCYVREPLQGLPYFDQPPPDCRQAGPTFCMSFVV